ncbi:MAG: four helix bundle protein [bacterium]|nr:four helix bundle protein [bacterium]
MANDKLNPNDKSQNEKKYDLEERTATFGERIIKFAQNLPKNEITRPIINQLIRAGTSVGANYMEADVADTKKDFHYKISICKKESKETCHWLRMMTVANPECLEEAMEIWKEGREFVLIFSSINRKRSNI